MTPRERVLAVLNGQKPDRVPWFGDLDYWATALIGRGEKPQDFKQSDAYLDWHRDLGVGFYLQGYFPFRTITEHCRVREWTEGNLRRRQIETPCGTLRETWTWLAESFAEAPTEHLVKSAADLRAYRYFHENTRYEPDYAFAERRRAQVGDMGVVLCYLPKSPLMQLIALDAGVNDGFRNLHRCGGGIPQDPGSGPALARCGGEHRGGESRRSSDDPGEPLLRVRGEDLLRNVHARL